MWTPARTCHPWRASATTRHPAAAARRAGALGHQGDEHRSKATTGQRWGFKDRHLWGLGRSAFPKPHHGIDGSRPKPVKSAFGVAARWAAPTLTGLTQRGTYTVAGSYMQKWEHGFIYVVTAVIGGEYQPKPFIAVEDSQGIRILKDVSDRLEALNIFGDLGWIISDSPYTTWQYQTSGVLFDLARREMPASSVTLNFVHFMRRPRVEGRADQHG